jgi:hypothetical protein
LGKIWGAARMRKDPKTVILKAGEEPLIF